MVFQGEQGPFVLQPAGVTCELTVSADHAVTRNHDGNGVFPVGTTYGANGFRVANRCSDVAITSGFTVRNLKKRVPDAALERRTLGREVEGKRLAFAFKVLVQLSCAVVVCGFAVCPLRQWPVSRSLCWQSQ